MAKTIYDHLFAWLVYVLSGSASVTLALWLFLSPFAQKRVFSLLNTIADFAISC